MPRVTAEYREARREEIADAALRCFTKRGFQATSMADIIEESGLSAGAIYGHYAGKQDIVFAAAQRALGARMSELREISSAQHVPPPSEMLGMMVRTISEQFGGSGVLIQIWAEAVVDPDIQTLVDAVFNQVREAFGQALAAWARQNPAPSRSDPDAWAAEVFPAFFGMAQGYLTQSALLSAFDGERYLASVERLLG